jgi:hypothetical protein
MKNCNLFLLILSTLTCLLNISTFAQNPIIQDQFTADPAARVFGDKVYLYPSHDIPAPEGKDLKKDWFCMEDYHVFSSSNLIEWTDHGVIVTQNKVNWVKPDSYALWAPDCIYKNGKYYFYFPAPAKDTTLGRGFFIGVAISETPYGPFIPEPAPIKNARGIDPNVFIDKDGQAYIYMASRGLVVARLKENMVELNSMPSLIANLPEKGLKEGPLLFERNGIYYLTFPHVEDTTERLEYAMSNSPMGPFKMAGVIMDAAPNGCWTNQQSFINFKDQWYIFYHQNDLSPKFDKNRSTRIDSLFFNPDGTIQKVVPTLRGVGVSDATRKIQIDRFSKISEKGISVELIDTLNTFAGWKTKFCNQNSWIQYNAVDFGKEKLKKIRVNAISPSGGTMQIRLDKIDGAIIAEVKISKCSEWKVFKSKVSNFQTGKHNIFVVLKTSNPVEIDWVQFAK